ncbi:flavin reductase family protein [Actinoallomurus rhizosphaericola]|uniref:flavin reductase family protein n=1 Tax=Actinoallomurus rhizosphaericola TaxID=2952536 RepID=UPI002091AF57|nr:flavin reductase family protein [Actinoallomurus rhizosphaericola]MCO5993388.1 flavin reductase family protein [Actinoallomurus rhizosphaericola]
MPDVCSPNEFRSLMSEFPSGVAIVTTLDDDRRPWGMTCSALCSLTTAPPTLLVCLRAESPTLDAILRRGTFAVNLLHGGSQSIAELFSSRTSVPERFASVDWSAGPSGPHLTGHAHAIADCRVARTADGGSHVVLFGRVGRVTQHRGPGPLLYGRRRYRNWPE